MQKVNSPKKRKKHVQFNFKPMIYHYEIDGFKNQESEGDESSLNGDEDAEEDENRNQRIVAEQQHYLYNKREMEMLRQVKKPFHKFIISFDDPVFKYDYNQLFLKDSDSRKKFYGEVKVSLLYMRKKKKVQIEEKILKQKQIIFQRKNDIKYFSQSNISKKTNRKSMNSAEIMEYSHCV